MGFVSVVTHVENLCGDGRDSLKSPPCADGFLESLESCSVLCFGVWFVLLSCAAAQAAWLFGLVKQFL